MTVAVRTLFETPSKARMSADEYIDFPLSAHKSDLIEGVFVMASPASFRHETVQNFVDTLLTIFVDAKGLGQVLGSNAAFRLSDENAFQPDIAFIRADRVDLAEDVYFPGPPDLAVEIISPSSRQYDEVEKRINYGRYGVREYWLIDPIYETIHFFSQAQGELLPIPAEQGVYHSRLLKGFYLRPEWLFPGDDSARPSVLAVARELGILG